MNDRPPVSRPSVNNPKVFWVGVVVGGAVMAYGVRGLLAHSADTKPTAWVKALFGLNLFHDFVLVPVILAVGAGASRLVPPRVRPVVVGGLFCSAVVTLFALPFVLGYGRIPESPSVLPLNYARGLVSVLAVVWVAVAVMAVVVLRRPQPDTAGENSGPELTNWRV